MTDQAGAELHKSALRWFGERANALGDIEKSVLAHAKRRTIATRGLNETIEGSYTFGERIADKVAEFGGSWTFIIIFAVVLAAWTVGNVWLLTRPFDPYPFIFLNLILSMLAAVQAPIIMMSQNRQTARDRQDAALDYEVNLKAEIEIMALHEKLDAFRDEHLLTLVAKQEEQITLLTRLLDERPLR